MELIISQHSDPTSPQQSSFRLGICNNHNLFKIYNRDAHLNTFEDFKGRKTIL